MHAVHAGARLRVRDYPARGLDDLRNFLGRVFEDRAVFGSEIEMNFGRWQTVFILRLWVKFDITFGRRDHSVLRIEVDQGGEALADFAFEVRAEAGGVVSEAGVADAEPRARIDDDVIALRKVGMRLLPVE